MGRRRTYTVVKLIKVGAHLIRRISFAAISTPTYSSLASPLTGGGGCAGFYHCFPGRLVDVRVEGCEGYVMRVIRRRRFVQAVPPLLDTCRRHRFKTLGILQVAVSASVGIRLAGLAPFKSHRVMMIDKPLFQFFKRSKHIATQAE